MTGKVNNLWDHNCNHRRLSRIFALCPVCQQSLNSFQRMGEGSDRRPLSSRAAVSIPFHDMNNMTGGQQDHV